MPFWRAHVWLFAVPLNNETYFRLTPQQVAFGEDFHAGGAILRDKGPAVATLDGNHSAALEDVIHEQLAVAEGGEAEAELNLCHERKVCKNSA